MLVLKRRQPESDAPPRKAALRWSVLLGDLSLFMSLVLARLIVRRVLRARRRERMARLRKMKLVNGGGPSMAASRHSQPHLNAARMSCVLDKPGGVKCSI